MSLNAANPVAIPDPLPSADAPDFESMSDRELSEYTARTLHEIVTLARGIQANVTPAMDRLTKHPLLGGLFR